ncbi:MAG: Mur ligase family protein, partial [Clostridia bacterium]
MSELLNGLRYEITGDDNIDIACLACDTSEVKKGCMFFCIEGGQVDGHKLYGKAVGDGAIALVVEHYVKSQVTQIKTEDTRKFMALVAKNYYHNAIDNMKLICVVGTNGKTSTTYLIDSIFTEAGYNTGLIGSNGVFICGERFANKLTTPDPIDLHGW